MFFRPTFLTALIAMGIVLQLRAQFSPTPSLPTPGYSNNRTTQRKPYGSALQPKTGRQMVQYAAPKRPTYPRSVPQPNVLTHRSEIPTKKKASIQHIQQQVQTTQTTDRKLASTVAHSSSTFARQPFEQAYNELVAMLEGRQPLDLKKAVFLCENAWFGGRMSADDFYRKIHSDAQIIALKMQQDGLAANDIQAINYTTHQFLSDTLTIQDPGRERQITTYPKAYDFDDPFGKRDPRKQFVSKVMAENTGQCKSLPLYYLMLIEALGGSAYLAFSPSHSYIRCKNKHGRLFNLELTNGMLTTDSWIVGSGYVKAEAVKGGIYLDTLNKKQVIAHCLVDLSNYYRSRFSQNDGLQGYDAFTLRCINQTLNYHPTNIHALLHKSNYYTYRLNYRAQQLGYTTEAQLVAHPETRLLFQQRNTLYTLTDELGYEAMPEAVYTNWLQTLQQKQQQQRHKQEWHQFSKFNTY